MARFSFILWAKQRDTIHRYTSPCDMAVTLTVTSLQFLADLHIYIYVILREYSKDKGAKNQKVNVQNFHLV